MKHQYGIGIAAIGAVSLSAWAVFGRSCQRADPTSNRPDQSKGAVLLRSDAPRGEVLELGDRRRTARLIAEEVRRRAKDATAAEKRAIPNQDRFWDVIEDSFYVTFAGDPAEFRSVAARRGWAIPEEWKQGAKLEEFFKRSNLLENAAVLPAPPIIRWRSRDGELIRDPLFMAQESCISNDAKIPAHLIKPKSPPDMLEVILPMRITDSDGRSFEGWIGIKCIRDPRSGNWISSELCCYMPDDIEFAVLPPI
jgi:hypothetical protein